MGSSSSSRRDWSPLATDSDMAAGKTTGAHGGRKTKVPADRLKLYNEFLHMDDPEVKLDPQDEENEQENLAESGEE